MDYQSNRSAQIPSGGNQPTNAPFADKTLVCKECGKEFVWTAGEQEFFASKGFRNRPTRCKDCRKQNRQKVEAEYFKITCSNCHEIGEALFKPSNPDAEIFCKKCFEEKFLRVPAGTPAAS